jgi:outer membrane biosynthesis protein TonB
MSDRTTARRSALIHPVHPGHLIRHAMLVAILVAGCGGKHADTTPGGGAANDGEPAARQDGDQVPPEKMDEINRNLERKRPIMSRCLAMAVDNKELPKNSAGKVTVELVISPGGKADNVKIVRANLKSKTLEDCVINRVKEIQFPDLPKPYETSYTYGFEAM